MQSLQEDMAEFRRQLAPGTIQKAYKALLSYMLDLRTHFKSKYGDSAVSGLYQGYLDMTYFALYPPFLRERALKIAVVFNYDAFKFEAWLAASNRQVQRRYWEVFKDSQWPNYRVVAPAKGIDAIIECDLAQDFNLDEPDILTAQIETATSAFAAHMERFLVK